MLDLNTLYCKFIELKECSNIRDEWKDEYREFFKEQYKLYGNGARGFVKKSFVRKKLTEVYPDEWLYFVSTLQSKYELVIQKCVDYWNIQEYPFVKDIP
jgi:hypothetical protein